MGPSIYVFIYWILISLSTHQVVFLDRGHKYIYMVKGLNSKWPTVGKQLQTFPHRVQGFNHRPEVGGECINRKFAEIW